MTRYAHRRQNFGPDFPDCPPGISELKYAIFVFGKRCMICGASGPLNENTILTHGHAISAFSLGMYLLSSLRWGRSDCFRWAVWDERSCPCKNKWHGLESEFDLSLGLMPGGTVCSSSPGETC
ncbi:hypothetical protein BS47DRAFT_863984 [Hydnum rufescens UP504]|uniref:Uncharacterized protein n=1 Tax=Hydnum rufescens UP504 TaxID=1448309 RepID=A0A9P6B075_9AGAM|nr:hypothetical protein BS47DRAFT_863984 [Hydnum rufescens UP504]